MTAARPVLYGYWRSSAAYRVRLALACKGLAYDSLPVDLRIGAQGSDDYRARNPQGLVPALAIDGDVLGQSLAIIEYLEETAGGPALLPTEPLARAHVRAAAQIIACDIHPINNLRVLRYLKQPLGHDQATIDAWARHWITSGLTALETIAARHGGLCLFGDTVTIADLCLVPQLYNARRIVTDLAAFPRLTAIDARLATAEFVMAAHPDAQVDSVAG
ncbi:maleylacetoacetate isomerase [Sandarakinorhabdus sp. DWP1-3-1]|uniref:maleylacetoacetate isomerase n=1 Tax=Sandarakinorhabdus sp. DWP1-3-1 TaxID=2804627 RepID=UPI003CF7857D